MAKASRKQPEEPEPAAAPPQGRRPEKKIGPFTGGVSVAIWVNTVATESGPKQFRSITIAPRRYLDRQTNEWRDASSYQPGDLPALIFALAKAQEYVFETPLPGGNEPAPGPQSDGVPF